MKEDVFANPSLVSGSGDVRQFLESALWQDMNSLLNERIYGLRNQLSIGIELGVEEIRLIQGHLRGLEDMKMLPHAILLSLEEEEVQRSQNNA